MRLQTTDNSQRAPLADGRSLSRSSSMSSIGSVSTVGDDEDIQGTRVSPEDDEMLTRELAAAAAPPVTDAQVQAQIHELESSGAVDRFDPAADLREEIRRSAGAPPLTHEKRLKRLQVANKTVLEVESIMRQLKKYYDQNSGRLGPESNISPAALSPINSDLPGIKELQTIAKRPRAHDQEINTYVKAIAAAYYKAARLKAEYPQAFEE